ncbi:thiocillin family RiPP [Streptomyces litmocidini]|uniref:thiocillin family RiPP n=1 Tax=Streptomyces litmocidini TaxID=67318 RepID=UPI0036F5FFB4
MTALDTINAEIDTDGLVAEDIAIEELTDAGGTNCFGTLGSAGCPVCFGTYGCAT